MTYTINDLIGFVAATLLGVPVLLLPGFVLAYATDFCGFRRADPARRLLTAVLVATAALPVLLALTARAGGVNAAVACTVLMAGKGLYLLKDETRPAWNPRAFFAYVLWAAVVAATWIDFDTGDGLHVSLLVVDMVKHAVTVRAISDTGIVPPPDVFFLRDQAASYYYYYFLTSAVIERLGLGLVDARMAVAGQVVWTGIAVLALAALLFEQLGLGGKRQKPPLGLIAALFCVGGLQLFFVAMRLVVNQQRVPQVTAALGEPVTPFVPSLLWVPHHVSGVLAAWCAFLALIQVMQRTEAQSHGYSLWFRLKPQLPLVLLAAAALASSAGLTVWVTIGAAMIAAVWGLVLLVERRWLAIAIMVVAGAVAVCLAAPDLLDMVRNRVGDQAAFGLFVRPMALTELISWVILNAPGDNAAVVKHPLYIAAQLALHPIAYIVEAGLFFIGTFLFWRATWRSRHGAESSRWFPTETSRLLFISAAVTLIACTFVESTVLNNDFGWRVPLFWQLAALVWTASVLLPVWQRTTARLSAGAGWAPVGPALRRLPASLTLVGLLGCLAVAYDIAGMRLYPVLGTEDLRHTEFDPDVIRDLRAAHEWLGRNVPLDKITQHNPDGHRALGFGLYGHQRVAVADKHNGSIFGASRPMVRDRFQRLAPVFSGTLSASDVFARLVAERVDLVVVTSLDTIWAQQAAWAMQTAPLFANGHVRVIEVAKLRPALAGVPLAPASH
jgi:hypothetical protein